MVRGWVTGAAPDMQGKLQVLSVLNPSFVEGRVGNKFHNMSVLGEKVKCDCHVSFPNSEIFSCSVTNSFEYFFCLFLRTTRADIEEHRWSAYHSLRNAGVIRIVIGLLRGGNG